MHRRRAAVLLVVSALLLGACKRKPPPTAKPDAASPDAAAPLTRFAAEAAAQKARNGAAWAKAEACHNDAYDAAVATSDASGWLLGVSDVKVDTESLPGFDPLCDFTWSLVYVDLEKNQRDAKMSRGSGGYSGSKGVVGIHAVGELLVVYTNDISPNNAARRPVLGDPYVWQSGTIVRDPRFGKKQILEEKDVDGDGKVDLVLYSPFLTSHYVPIPITGETQVTGPSPIAHQIAAGFSFDDAVARSLVRAKCPEHPPAKAPVIDRSVLLESNPGTQQLFAELEDWIVCSRFWGVSTADVKKGFRGCKSYIDNQTIGEDPDGGARLAQGACPDYLLGWAQTPVPFVLP